jgi:hypothetical protein
VVVTLHLYGAMRVHDVRVDDLRCRCSLKMSNLHSRNGCEDYSSPGIAIARAASGLPRERHLGAGVVSILMKSI